MLVKNERSYVTWLAGNSTFFDSAEPVLQGWADKFLTTPANGIEDLYAWAGIKLPHNIMLKAVYHEFEAENNGMDYGDEIDLLAVWKIDKHFKLLTKIADYSADDFATDTTKYILEVNFSY